MNLIPVALLKKLYTVGSLKNTDWGAQFALKNRLADAELVAVHRIAIDGKPLAVEDMKLDVGGGGVLTPAQLDEAHPLAFPLRSTLTVQTGAPPLNEGKHQIEISFQARPFGELQFTVEDSISTEPEAPGRLPREAGDDYSPAIVLRRRAFIEKMSGVSLKHLAANSFDPHAVEGNCESFVGVAQVPIGFAGPLRVCGEHADGEFMIPMATTEGTMVASYNRGMKVLNLSGGVKVAVSADAMQRAPVFVLRDARSARDFEKWVQANMAQIRAEAEATSSIARLTDIDAYSAIKFVYLRFNFTTGDAAGQNMVGRATFAACKWILEHAEGIDDFFLESNFATDKKASWVNVMRTRGKRVTAEATIPRDVLKERLRTEPENLVRHYGVANVGALMSGANNNGLQSANGITALFIATGQDAANVAESSAGILYTEVTSAGDLYVAITIPSLIVASHGGGTGLPTQRECLEILGCYGIGKVNKLAEIIGGVVLAGEISLAGAIASDDWVPSHEKFGRNR
jgi:hydroxymethylglutaryl-CoA reductase (NADPH)